MSYPNSKTRRGRVQEGGAVSPTITASNQEIAVVIPHIAAMLDIKGHEFIRRVHDAAGVSPTIPFCGGGGQQPKIIVVGNSVKSGHATGNVVEPDTIVNGKQPSLGDRIYDTNGVSTAIATSTFFTGSIAEENPKIRKVRVRKLTEKECWRLMAVKDEDYRLVARHQSSSSMYHLAGDSIVTTCNMAIFGELFGIEWRSKVRALVEALKEKEDSV